MAGEDRCDPGSRNQKRREECATVIEARSEEFPGRDPAELSPEQRLLSEQPQRSAGTDIAGAARRLAVTGQTDSSVEALGVAAVALQQTAGMNNQEKAAGEAIASEAEAAVLNATFPLYPGGASPQR